MEVELFTGIPDTEYRWRERERSLGFSKKTSLEKLGKTTHKSTMNLHSVTKSPAQEQEQEQDQR